MEGKIISATAKKINDLLAFPFALLSTGKITFADFLEELEVLELKGKQFGPEEYRLALEKFLGIRIEVTLIDDLEDIEAQHTFAERGDTAILYLQDEQHVVIFVLASLSEVEMSAAIYHELAHLAAGHRFREVSESRERRHRVVGISKLLAKQVPPRTHRACEREARIREDYCMLAGSLGERCLKQDQLRQIQ